MKTINLTTRLWGIATAILLALPHVEATVTHSLTFSASNLNIATETIDNTVYAHVNYAGLENSGEVAMPMLPAQMLTFSVPYDAYDFTISVTTSGDVTTTLTAKVYPYQEARVMSDTTTYAFTLPDSVVYGTNALYPQNIGQIVGHGYMGGDNHLVTVAIYPTQYNPVTSQLVTHGNVTMTLNYTSGHGVASLPIKPLSRKTPSLRADMMAQVKNTVANPMSVEGNSPALPAVAAPTFPGYEYCVITSRELAPAFERLVAWKRQKGYKAGIVCMEDILASSLFQNGDTVSGINDDAGKLRQYLNYAFENCGTEYVLLGGKEPHVPVRKAYISSGIVFSLYNMPTDMYFAELNSNWDSNHNSKYGEELDSIEYDHELYVGRLLCKNQEEVNNYIDKLLIYELNPGNGDYSYLGKAFQTFSYDFRSERRDVNHELLVKDEVEQLFDDVVVFRQYERSPTGYQVISELKKNYGYFNLHGHGTPEGITLLDDTLNVDGQSDWIPKLGVSATDTLRINLYEEPGNGLDCLKNKYYPNVQYSMSCTPMPYDIYTGEGKTYNIDLNFGESFTLGKDYGGVAFLGNTRVGYFGANSSIHLEKIFLKILNLGITKLGKAEALSKTDDYLEVQDFSHHIRLTHNLLGDPEFDMWTDIPLLNGSEHYEVMRTDGAGIWGIVANLDNCIMAVYNTDGTAYRANLINSGANFPTVSTNSIVTIYKPNIIPYIAPVLWQRETISSQMYIQAQTAALEHNVDGNRQAGDIIFADGANITIDAADDILVTSGFVVQDGAIVTLRSRGVVKITGGIVKNGGVLNIEATKIEITKPFTAENDALLNFSEIEL